MSPEQTSDDGPEPLAYPERLRVISRISPTFVVTQLWRLHAWRGCRRFRYQLPRVEKFGEVRNTVGLVAWGDVPFLCPTSDPSGECRVWEADGFDIERRAVGLLAAVHRARMTAIVAFGIDTMVDPEPVGLALVRRLQKECHARRRVIATLLEDDNDLEDALLLKRIFEQCGFRPRHDGVPSSAPQVVWKG